MYKTVNIRISGTEAVQGSVTLFNTAHCFLLTILNEIKNYVELRS
jgi:hypothetical protein